MRLAGLVLLVAALAGCPKPPGPPPVTPDAADASQTPPASCADVCDNINRLGCSSAKACSSVCDRLLRQRFKDCVARATSCAAVDNCDVPENNRE